jgi:microcystin-dependent protein
MSSKAVSFTVAVMILLSGVIVFAQEATVPQLINYQGRLTGADGKELPTADYKLSISLYSDPTATTTSAKVWGPQTFNVPVVKGHFNVILGPVDEHDAQIQDAFTTSSVYLEVTVNDTSIIRPRQRILSTPFALRSDYAVSALSALHGVPVGTLVPYIGSTAPEGWVLCSGQEIDKDASPHLAKLVALLRQEGFSAPGSPDSKAFLPDMRGRMPLGLDNIGGTEVGRITQPAGKMIGGSGGEEVHLLSINEMPKHSHTYTALLYSSSNRYAWGVNDMSQYDYIKTGEAGGDQSHNNMPPYLAMNYIVKY